MKAIAFLLSIPLLSTHVKFQVVFFKAWNTLKTVCHVWARMFEPEGSASPIQIRLVGTVRKHKKQYIKRV